jgi:hypothetical protein
MLAPLHEAEGNLFEVGFHAMPLPPQNTTHPVFLPQAQHSLSINAALGGSMICTRQVESQETHAT